MRLYPSVALLASLLLCSCATGPVSYLSATPKTLDDAYSCALAKVNELGYTITNTNKDAGFIAGTKQTSGLGTKLLTGSEYHDQLTVSIFNQANGGRTMRATAGRVDQRASLLGTSTNTVKPSAAGIADANDVLLACGEGAVSKQPDLSSRASFEVRVGAGSD